MNWVVLYIFLFFMSFILTAYIRSYALKKNYIDMPNERSSHVIPTPRGGGIAFAVSFIIGITIGYILDMLPKELFFALCIIGIGLALLGFYDDRYNLSAKLRFTIQLILSVCSLWALGLFQQDILPVIAWIAGFMIVFYLMWFINLYNFMDGIDGYVVMETLFISASLYILCADFGVVFLCMFFSVLGFGLWNFPQAKIFMGDVGSVFAGGTLAIISIYVLIHHPLLCIPWFILVALFMTDATLTLGLRIIKGEKFWVAHRQHAYQYLTQLVKSHVVVTSVGCIINVFYLFPLAYFTLSGALSPYSGLMFAYIPLAMGVLWCKRSDLFKIILQ